MHTKSLLKQLLRIEKIVIENTYFEAVDEEAILVIRVRPLARDKNRCPHCGKRCPGYDSQTKVRRWRSLDLGSTRVYLESTAPRVQCPEHGVVVAKVPWARHATGYTYDFETTVTWLALHATAQDIAEYFRIDWHMVGSIARRVQRSLEAEQPNRFNGLSEIGIDETSYKKGHKYMTVVVNHRTGSLIWAAKGHGKEVLSQFFEELTEEQRAGIRLVSTDGARWITSCINAYCPNAERCIDPFHVVAWANDCLDEVRKQAVREAKEKAAEGEKAQRSSKKKSEKQENPKVQRYALLKNPENLTRNQQAAMDMLIKSDKRLYRAYLLKESLRAVFKCDAAGADEELTRWLAWAQRSRIKSFVELGKKIKRHREAVLATIAHGLSNARIEAVNNKIKVTIRMGYGFRNIDNLIALVRLKCGDYEVNLPGRKNPH